MGIFEERESEVRSYCRKWPVVFDRAAGGWLYDEHGRPYLDFFSGAGALNYGHNNPVLKEALLEYLARDGVVHSLDMYTVAKADFLTALDELVLGPGAWTTRCSSPVPRARSPSRPRSSWPARSPAAPRWRASPTASTG